MLKSVSEATVYLVGQVVGALVFGFATDQLGRKKLFGRHGLDMAA